MKEEFSHFRQEELSCVVYYFINEKLISFEEFTKIETIALQRASAQKCPIFKMYQTESMEIFFSKN